MWTSLGGCCSASHRRQLLMAGGCSLDLKHRPQSGSADCGASAVHASGPAAGNRSSGQKALLAVTLNALSPVFGC